MQLPAQEPSSIDLPAVDQADLKVVRFGAGAAFIVLIIVSAVGALLVHGVMMREQADNAMEAERKLQLEAWASVIKPSQELADDPAADTSAATPPETAELGSAPPQDPAAISPEQRARIDRAYSMLDKNNIGDMRAFLIRYGDNRYARDVGYLRRTKAALRDIMAAEQELTRQAQEAEQEEEQMRRKHQQAIPWDLGVAPP
jgi:hypothetical protein